MGQPGPRCMWIASRLIGPLTRCILAGKSSSLSGGGRLHDLCNSLTVASLQSLCTWLQVPPMLFCLRLGGPVCCDGKSRRTLRGGQSEICRGWAKLNKTPQLKGYEVLVWTIKEEQRNWIVMYYMFFERYSYMMSVA